MILKLKNVNFTSQYPISIKNVDIDKIIIFYKVSFDRKGFKYFIGHKNDEKVKPFCIMLPKMNGYLENCGESKYMFFLIKDDELLEKHNNVYDKTSNSIKKDLIVNQIQ